MSIRIARGARSGWREGRLQFRILSKADGDLLHAVVSRIGERLVELDTDDEYGPKFVSDLLVLPDGIAFWLDSPDASPAMTDRIVATIVDGLENAGIEGRLSGGSRGRDRTPGPQVALAGVPHPAPARDAIAVVPWDEIVRALDWALEDPAAEVAVESGAVLLALPPMAAREYINYLHRRGQSCHVLADGTAERRECSISHPADERRSIVGCPHLGLAWSGPAVRSDIDAAFETMVAFARTIGDWAATVHVTVHPGGHDVFVVHRPWHHEPSGHDATLALADHLLDAFPWQRLRPSQAELLPDPLHDLASYDAASGELRMGRLDHWLREPATARHSEFTRAMRSMLGQALATRDVAWARERGLPTSLPRPSGELAVEEPPIDLDAVPLASSPRPHPSLGVTPLELLSLRRGDPFYDAVDVSLPLRIWLDGLSTSSPQDHEPIWRVVASLVEADVGQRHAPVHMAVLEEWLVRRLTPALVGAAGFGDPDLLRDRLPPPTVARSPSDTVQVLLGVLAEVVALDPSAIIRNPYEQSPAARTASGIAVRTGAASCTGQPRGRLSPFADVINQLRTMLREGTPFDDQTARSLWWTGARALGSEAVAEAYERARVADARQAQRWRDAEPGSWPPEAFADAGAPALYRTDDPDAAWDIAVELGAAITPVSGSELIAALTDRLPADLLAAGWADARRTLASIHARTRLAAANAVRGATAAMLCQLAVAKAAEAGHSDLLYELTWSAVDDLVRDLIA